MVLLLLPLRRTELTTASDEFAGNSCSRTRSIAGELAISRCSSPCRFDAGSEGAETDDVETTDQRASLCSSRHEEMSSCIVRKTPRRGPQALHTRLQQALGLLLTRPLRPVGLLAAPHRVAVAPPSKSSPRLRLPRLLAPVEANRMCTPRDDPACSSTRWNTSA